MTVVGSAGVSPASMTRSTAWSSSSLTSQPRVRGSVSPGRISVLESNGSPSSSSSACTTVWSGIRTPTVRLRGCRSRRGTSGMAGGGKGGGPRGGRRGVQEPTRHLRHGGEDEGVGPRRDRPDGTEGRVVDLDQLSQLAEVLADQGEVVPVVQAADAQDPVAALAVPGPTAQGIARVGRVGDQRVVAQCVDDLLKQALLGVVGMDVDVPRHNWDSRTAPL